MPLGGELDLENAYTSNGAVLGTANKVAAALRKAAPGASFVLWEDPALSDVGMCLGEFRAYTPELGPFAAECDGEGQVVLNRYQIAGTNLGLPHGATADDLAAALQRAAGAQWTDAWRAS